MKENMKDVVAVILTIVIGIILYKVAGLFFKAIWIAIIMLVAYFIVKKFIIKSKDIEE